MIVGEVDDLGLVGHPVEQVEQVPLEVAAHAHERLVDQDRQRFLAGAFAGLGQTSDELAANVLHVDSGVA